MTVLYSGRLAVSDDYGDDLIHITVDSDDPTEPGVRSELVLTPAEYASLRELITAETPRMVDHEVWDRPAVVRGGVSDTAVLVRYPGGAVIPVAVSAGETARALGTALPEGYTVTGARRTFRDGSVITRTDTV